MRGLAEILLETGLYMYRLILGLKVEKFHLVGLSQAEPERSRIFQVRLGFLDFAGAASGL